MNLVSLWVAHGLVLLTILRKEGDEGLVLLYFSGYLNPSKITILSFVFPFSTTKTPIFCSKFQDFGIHTEKAHRRKLNQSNNGFYTLRYW